MTTQIISLAERVRDTRGCPPAPTTPDDTPMPELDTLRRRARRRFGIFMWDGSSC